jgi:hypothetical protein
VRLFIKLGVDMGACYWVWLFFCFVLGYQDIYGLVTSGLLLFVFVLGFNAFWYWIHSDIMLGHLLLVLCHLLLLLNAVLLLLPRDIGFVCR